MNKKQLRKIVEDSIQYAEEQDAASQQRRRASGFDRKWDRLNYFLIALHVALNAHEQEVGDLIKQFQKRVICGENALLDKAVGDSGSAK